MNSEEDEFKRIEREALRRAEFQRKVDNAMRIAFEAAWDDDDTQSYTSEMLLAEAYRCGFEAGAVAEREACAKVCESHVRYPSRLHFATAIRARKTT